MMSCLYVVEQGSKIKHIGGQFILEVKDGEYRVVPDEILKAKINNQDVILK